MALKSNTVYVRYLSIVDIPNCLTANRKGNGNRNVRIYYVYCVYATNRNRFTYQELKVHAREEKLRGKRVFLYVAQNREIVNRIER